MSGGSIPPTATKFFFISEFSSLNNARKLRNNRSWKCYYHLRHAVMRYVGTRQSRFARSLPRIVSIEHYVLNLNGECNGSIPFLSPRNDSLQQPHAQQRCSARGTRQSRFALKSKIILLILIFELFMFEWRFDSAFATNSKRRQNED